MHWCSDHRVLFQKLQLWLLCFHHYILCVQIWRTKGFRRSSWICKRIHQHHAALGLLGRIYSTGRPQSWALVTAPTQEGCSLSTSISLLITPLSLQKWISKQRWAGVCDLLPISFSLRHCEVFTFSWLLFTLELGTDLLVNDVSLGNSRRTGSILKSKYFCKVASLSMSHLSQLCSITCYIC